MKQEDKYLDKINKITNYLDKIIIKNKNNPFTSYKLYHLKEHNDEFEWELNIKTDKTMQNEEFIKWNKKIISLLCEFGEKNNCEDILDDIVIII